jgi:hypothetical protein
MSGETNGYVDYEAVLADLIKRRDQLETAIAAITLIKGASGGSSTSSQGVPPNAFFTLGIVDATKKYLGMVHSKQTLPQIIDALHQGGMPPLKPNTVYAALRRRQGTVGDIINVGDQWGLKEWFSNVPVPRKAPATKKQPKVEDVKPQGATPPAAGVKKEAAAGATGGMSQLDACEDILTKADRVLHITEISAKLPEYGKPDNPRGLSGNLRQDTRKRFENLGENYWALAAWPEEKKRRSTAPTLL